MFDNNPRLADEKHPEVYSESSRFVLGWLARLYAHDTLMFIRREFDKQAGTINVLNLLSEIQKRRQVLTRRRYRQFFEPLRMPEYAKDGLANDYFNRFNIVRGLTEADDYISPDQAKQDLDSLGTQVEAVHEFANRMLAHRAPPWQPPPLNVSDDLDSELRAVQEVFNNGLTSRPQNRLFEITSP